MKRLLGTLWFLLWLQPAAAAQVVERINEQSGLSRWLTEGQDFSIELVQLIPDFVRAVFDSKGLPDEIIDEISRYCVFGTIVRNRSSLPLSYDMTTWRYVTRDGKVHHARPKSDWVAAWREMGVAFRWTLLHEAQTYQPGDWGQGFTTIDLPHGTVFDLHYNWTEDGALHHGIIEGLRCAPAELEK